MSSSAYFEAVTASDEALQKQQQQIIAACDAGRITMREAANQRIAALTAHLAACREARRRYLEGTA